MFFKGLPIFVILLLTSNVTAGQTLYELTETLISTENDGKLILPLMGFSYELNTGSTYQINFTNLISSQSSMLVHYADPSSKLVSSNTSPINESFYLLTPGETLQLIFEKLRCEYDVVVSRNAIIELVNDTSSSIKIEAELKKDTGECKAPDNFLPYPFFPTILSAWIIVIVVKKNKLNK